MKVSKEKKSEIRKRLIKTAVEVMTEKGFQDATMREISNKAGYGSATIYHYFPNKEKILYAYFEDKHNDLVKLLKKIPEFEIFTLKEKLQAQMESLFDMYLEDRKFVQEAYKLMFDSPLRTFTEMTPIKELFIKTVSEFFEESIRKNEIQDYVFSNFIHTLYWDYTGVMVLYWCNDTSNGLTNTSRIIDMSLDIIVEILRSGLIVKFSNIVSFVFRNHIYSNFQSISNIFPIKDVFQHVMKGAGIKTPKDDNKDGQTKKVPKGKIKRSGIIGATTARAGLKKLEYLSKKPFLSKEKGKKYKDANNEEVAKIIFSALGTLKGAPLKLAQLMAMEIELLPEAYQKELSKCAYQVPSINRALIRKVIKQELGDWPENIFKTFEAVPFAAASLGQVHKAVSHEGDELTVKVQYPGISAGVKSDMDMLKAILKMTSYARLFEGAIKEIEERISEELDYENEARNTNYFRDNLKLDNIIIPSVYEELSTETVLTISRIEGLHLDAWLNTNPSQEKRNYYGQLLYDLFLNSIHQNMLIHADPNIGNYLFRDDGKLGLIDFGCVKKLEDNFIQNLEILTYSFKELDFERFKKMFGTLGIYYKTNIAEKDFYGFISNWIEWVTRPIRADFFDFAPPDYFIEAKKFIPKIYNYIDRFDGSMLYFGRTEYGLFRILHRLGVKVRIKIF